MQNIFILNEQEAPVAILNPELPEGCPFYDDVLTRRLEHGYMTFEFEVPADHPTSKAIARGGYVVYPYTKDNRPYYFRILDAKENNTDGYRKKVFCENAAVDDLLGNVVRPATLTSYTLEQAINYVLSGSEWVCGDAEFAGVKDIKLDDYMTSLEALHKVLDAFGAEIEFHVRFEGLRVVEKKVSGVLRRGKATKKPFVYGLDLVEVEREEDTSNLVTAMIGVGKGDTSGQFLTFANFTPAGLDTTKYEKPHAVDWVGSLEAFQRWGKRGRHVFGIHRDDTATNPVELFNNTLAALDKYSKPLYTYRVGVVLLADLLGLEAHEVDLGDDVVIKDTTFQPELVLDARIIETKESVRDPSRNEVTLGEFRPILLTENQRIEDIQRRLDQKEASWDHARNASGTGAHVVANGPKPLVDGEYRNLNHWLAIEVTENVHLAYTSVFCETAGQTGTVELRDSSDNVIQTRTFTGLVAGENKLQLDFLLTKGIRHYRLWGDFSGNTWRTTEGIQYPYDSGAFKVTGTSSTSGYWYHFYNMMIGGAGVVGGYGSAMTMGDTANRLGRFEFLDDQGETTMLIDNNQITMSRAVIAEVVSPTVVNVSTEEAATYYVNPTTGDDDNSGASGSPLKTVSAAISRIPRVFDGLIEIKIMGDLTEDIDIMGFLGSGRLKLWFNNHTYTGSITIRSVKARVDIHDAIINYREGETSAPVVAFQSDYVNLNNCIIRGNAGTEGTIACVQVFDGSFVYLDTCELYNSNTALVRASFGAKACVRNTKGRGAPTGLRAEYAGLIAIAGYIPDCSLDYEALFGGQIIFQGTPPVDSGLPQAAPTPPKRGSWNSTSGDSWRTRYNGWRNDSTVRQGQWNGYGLHTGIWLFPSTMSSTVEGKTIKAIRVKLTRLREGGNDNTTVTIRWHGHTSRPSGTPVVSSESVNATFQRGQTREISLPTSFFPHFSSGSAKGIALFTSNSTNAYYAAFDDSASISIDYV